MSTRGQGTITWPTIIVWASGCETSSSRNVDGKRKPRSRMTRARLVLGEGFVICVVIPCIITVEKHAIKWFDVRYDSSFVSSVMLRSSPFQFRTPCSVFIVGPSGSGKTVFTTRLMTVNLDLFSTRPSRVHYCYGSWQKGFDALKKKGVHFSAGVPSEADLDKWFPNGGLLVMDDLMTEGNDDKTVLDIFTKHSHHRNITVLSGHVSSRQVRQEHLPQCALHRGLQKSPGAVGSEKRGAASLSSTMVDGHRRVPSGHESSVWIPRVGSSPGQQR